MSCEESLSTEEMEMLLAQHYKIVWQYRQTLSILYVNKQKDQLKKKCMLQVGCKY